MFQQAADDMASNRVPIQREDAKLDADYVEELCKRYARGAQMVIGGGTPLKTNAKGHGSMKGSTADDDSALAANPKVNGRSRFDG
jgi:hypothetical protein